MREGGATPPYPDAKRKLHAGLAMVARGRTTRGWRTRVRRLRTLRVRRLHVLRMHRLRTLRVRDHRLRSAVILPRYEMRCGACRRGIARERLGTVAAGATILPGRTCSSGETRSALAASRRSRATNAIYVAGRTGNRLVRREAIVVCRGMRCIRGSAVGAAGVRGRGGP